jgi:hypothetical protein
MILTKATQQGKERNAWLVGMAKELLTGRKIIVVNLHGIERDRRLPEIEGPLTVEKVESISPEDGAISVHTEYGIHCSNIIESFEQRGFVLHTVCENTAFPIYRLFKVIVPTREDPQGTTVEQRNTFHERWNEAVYEGPHVSRVLPARSA